MAKEQKNRILILEDVPADAELVKRELRKVGKSFTSRIVKSEEAFLQALKDFTPDLILADYSLSLPSFDGISAMNISKTKFPNIPFIMVSGRIGEEAVLKCLHSGAIDYIPKENLQRLGPAVTRALNEAKEKEKRQKAEEALKESEERYRSIFEGSNDAIFLADPQSGIVLSANRAAEKLLGRSKKEIIGMEQGRMHPPEKAQEYREMFRKGVQTRNLVDWEAEIMRKDGTLVPVSISASVLSLKGKEVMLGIFRDITERKKYTENLERTVQERTKEIRNLNEQISEKLEKKIQQINNISKIREQLKKTMDVESRLEIIFERAIEDLGMDVAAVILIDKDRQTVEAKHFKSKVDITFKEEYRWEDSIEKVCLHQRTPHSKINKDRTCILDTTSVHCAPIFLKDQVIGVLALGSMKEEILNESDLSVLNLYSELATTVFESAEFAVEPTIESAVAKESKYRLKLGSACLIEDDVNLSYEIFTDIVMSGREGLCITRNLPKKVKQKYGLKKTPIVWLNEITAEDQQTVFNLNNLSLMISNFVKEAKTPIILIDGIEYLITINGFNPVIRFLQTKRSQIETANGILIIPLCKDALEPKETRLIERECIPYTPKKTIQY